MHRLLKLLLSMGLITLAGAANADIGPCANVTNLEYPTQVNTGETPEFLFYVGNFSPDGEIMTQVRITFPDCFTVIDGSTSWGYPWDFELAIVANVIEWVVPPGGLGIDPLTGDNFVVTVLIGEDCDCGPATVAWYIAGDGTGADPHLCEGLWDIDIDCSTATETRALSTIRSLY